MSEPYQWVLLGWFCGVACVVIFICFYDYFKRTK